MWSWLKMAGKKSCTDITVYHTLSLSLLNRLQPGDEHLAHDILSTIIFNVDFLRFVCMFICLFIA